MRTLLFIAVFCLFAGHAESQDWENADINNISARINANGQLFSDDSSHAAFEVPKGSSKHTIAASGMWIGGYDDNGQLKVSVQTYPNAPHHFWPGPLDNTDTSALSLWNKVWKISREEIDTFIYEYTNGFPNVNYTVPQSIVTWPGNRDSASWISGDLLSYMDVDHDGIYNYLNGDYPCIKGDQAIAFICNDASGTQNPFNLNVEVHGMVYGYHSSVPAINNTLFVNYKILSFNTTTGIDSMSIGNWTDFNIGNYNDDYIASDVDRNMYYGYNGDADDEGASGYGLNAPAQGVLFLRGPDADVADGIDNNRDGSIDSTLYHTPNGDSVVPDTQIPEQISMSKFMAYSKTGDPVAGKPVDEPEYFSYLNGRWRNGVLQTYGGDGHGGGTGSTSDYSDFMFPGNSDPDHWGTHGIPEADWDEVSAGFVPDDVQGVASAGKFNFLPGEITCIDYAYVFAQAAGNMASVDSLRSSSDQVQRFYDSHAELQTCDCGSQAPSAVDEISNGFAQVMVFPNPSQGKLILQFYKALTGKADVLITDETGRVIRSYVKNFHAGFNSMDLNGAGFSKGIYILSVSSATGTVFKKIVIE